MKRSHTLLECVNYVLTLKITLLLDPGEGTNQHCQRTHQASPAQDHLVLHYYWHNTLLDKPGHDVMLI